MDVISIGAEARIVRISQGIRKERLSKGYRYPDLDVSLREARTKTEARLMKKAARAGVPVPGVEMVDESTLLIEDLDGDVIERILDDRPDLARQIGSCIARLHDAGIIHGDLTTSNMILSDRLFLIDFGLAFHSRKIEDMAVDIHVFRQAIESRHHRVSKEAFETFLEGYGESLSAPQVIDRLKIVEQRGRNK